MTSDTEEQDRKDINRRQFLKVCGTIVPGEVLKTNATKGGKRVAILNDALMQIGPPLALKLAERGHNLVIAQPAKGIVKEARATV